MVKLRTDSQSHELFKNIIILKTNFKKYRCSDH